MRFIETLRGVTIRRKQDKVSHSPRPAREHQSEQNKNGVITTAKISMLSAVVVALIGAATAVWVEETKGDRTSAASPPPDTTMQGEMPPSRPAIPGDGDTRDGPTSGDGAQVEFVFPQEGSTIDVGQDVRVLGNVTGLGGDHTFWILSRHDVGGSFYLVPPTVTKDGPWSVTDENVGDSLDKGSNFVYYAVQANAECTKTLSSMGAYDSFKEIPNGCTIQGQRYVRIR